MSRNGFSVLDDSHTMAMGEDGMVEPRQGNRADFYFFGYGHRYVECLQDFYRLCGKTPLALHALVARVDVGGHTKSRDVADMTGAVCIRPSNIHQNMTHKA